MSYHKYIEGQGHGVKVKVAREGKRSLLTLTPPALCGNSQITDTGCFYFRNYTLSNKKTILVSAPESV